MQTGVARHIMVIWLAIIVSLLFSPFASLSISMGALLVAALFQVEWQPLRIRLFPLIRQRFQQWRHYPDYWVIMLSMGIVLFSAWQTYDWTYWFIRLQIKVSFVLLPLAFVLLPGFSRRAVYHVFFALLLCFLVGNAAVLYHFLLDVEGTLTGLRKGQPMWTPNNHIRYSLLMALAVVGGVQLIRAGYYCWRKWERKLIVVLTGLCFLFLHFLAVKSGLLMLYVGLITLLLHYIWSSRRWALGLGLGVLLMAIPVGSYYAFPSLRHKVIYTIHDLMMYQQGQGDTYSDSGRIAALKAGWQIVQEYPVLGVGAGNLRHAMAVKFDEQYPGYLEKFMPPNQFLFVWAGTGLWGLLLFGLAFAFPFFYRQHYSDAFLLAFYMMQFISILIEHSLENIVGIVHYCFFLLLLMKSIPADTERWQEEGA